MEKITTLLRTGIFTLLTAFSLPTIAQTSTARLQVIHNAADPAAASVDIYAGNDLLLDNFAFRTASPYVNVPAGVPVVISVAPPTSTSVNDKLTDFTVTFTAGKTYVAVANGVLDPSSFAENPDEKNIAFTLWLKDYAKETADAGKVDLLVVHGATDAPAVDVEAVGVGTLVNNAVYGDVTPYISVPAAAYTLAVKDSTSETTVAQFAADLSGAGGLSAVVFASGFLSPEDNEDGAPFGLFAALPNGTVVPLSTVTGITSANPVLNNISVFPIPAVEYVNIDGTVENSSELKISVMDLNGNIVSSSSKSVTEGNQNIKVDLNSLHSGNYFVNVSDGSKSNSVKISVVK